MTTRSIVSGKSVLRKFLQSEQEHLSKSPVLIVSSAVSNHAPPSAHVAAVDKACRKVEFHTSMELGLRTVQSHVTSVFPTVENVNAALAMAKRTGATSVIGVGSGAAMDLTKAILQQTGGHMTGILVPSTCGAILASTSSHPLLLDTREEALILPENDGNSVTYEATIVLEQDSIADIYEDVAGHARLAIFLDAHMRGDHERSGKFAMEMEQKANDGNSTISDFFPDAGRLLSFGITEGSVRSSPLALAASLIPTCFPNAPMLTFMASLLPGIIQVMGAQQDFAEDLSDKTVPSLASLTVRADGAKSVETLMSHVKANRALWNCVDVDDRTLEAILHHSLNR